MIPEIKRKKNKLIYRNLFFSFISVSFLIIFLEFLFRVYNYFENSSSYIILSDNPALIFEHRPSVEFINKYRVKMNFNSLGFIGKEVRAGKEGIRILGIGDSITEAPYLEEKNRYLNKIQFFLEPQINKKIEVINAAVAGYNTAQELELLKSKGLKLQPDLVIVGICLNDSVSLAPAIRRNLFGGVIENIRDGSKARYFDFLYQKSDLYKFIYDRLAGSKRRFKKPQAFQDYLKGYEFRIPDKDWLLWEENLKGMIKVCRQKNIPILFVIFPTQNKVIRSEEFTHKPLSNLFNQEGVPFLDLIHVFKNESDKGEKIYLDYDLIHPSEFGHMITAMVISDYISRSGILEKDK